MKIDREHVKAAFTSYVEKYDAGNEKIKLKIDHTYRVSELCEQIANAQGLSPDETEFAWLSGILHDIGRFEQLRIYDTFQDAESVDHAQFGADILFLDGKLADYVTEISEHERGLLEKVIRLHNVYRLPETLTKQEKTFSDILRDADKIDILKVNVEIPIEEIYNVSTQELLQAKVSEAVMQSFSEHHATLRSLKQTAVDHLVGHISLVYELVYPISVEIVKKQGYLDRMLAFQSRNNTTMEQFQILRSLLKQYFQTTEKRVNVCR